MPAKGRCGKVAMEYALVEKKADELGGHLRPGNERTAVCPASRGRTGHAPIPRGCFVIAGIFTRDILATLKILHGAV